MTKNRSFAVYKADEKGIHNSYAQYGAYSF